MRGSEKCRKEWVPWHLGVNKVSRGKISPKFISGIILALFFGIALHLRVYLPYDQVFSGDWIKFTGVDAYYHMRIIDNLVHNFPHLASFNPSFIYPGGSGVGTIRFFDWLLATIIWVIGLGSPTQHTVDVVSVYFPAVLGALTVIPVYFIGKELFNRWAGWTRLILCHCSLPAQDDARAIQYLRPEWRCPHHHGNAAPPLPQGQLFTGTCLGQFHHRLFSQLHFPRHLNLPYH